MRIFRRAADLTDHRLKLDNQGLSAGFVPTMGALHEGHISLVNAAKASSDFVIVSIFVNPTQFNNKEDLAKYPVTLEKDLIMLEAAGCDMVFVPSVEEIYPAGYQAPHYALGRLEQLLEGAYRPGHFQGVCQVVHRLLDITQPTHLYMGQKDLQQCMVIRRLLELTGIQTQLVILPTKREATGLAMSSRNMRLSEAERVHAQLLYQVLSDTLLQYKLGGDIDRLEADGAGRLQDAGFTVDYLKIADAETLEAPVAGHKAAVLVAAALGSVRLIDNVIEA